MHAHSSLAPLLLCLLLLTLIRSAPVEIPEYIRCTDGCLDVQEECLLNSIEMLPCVNTYDDCHRNCTVTYQPDLITPAPTNPDPKIPDGLGGGGDGSKDVDVDVDVNVDVDVDVGGSGDSSDRLPGDEDEEFDDDSGY